MDGEVAELAVKGVTELEGPRSVGARRVLLGAASLNRRRLHGRRFNLLQALDRFMLNETQCNKNVVFSTPTVVLERSYLSSKNCTA